MKPENNSNLIAGLFAKIIACIFIVLFLALGLLGLIMPIIPGLLFLAIAAMITANISPVADRWLRKSSTMRGYLDSGAGFSNLTFWGKTQYSCWLLLKVFIDSIVFIIAVVAKTLSFASRKYQYYQNS